MSSFVQRNIFSIEVGAGDAIDAVQRQRQQLLCQQLLLLLQVEKDAKL